MLESLCSQIRSKLDEDPSLLINIQYSKHQDVYYISISLYKQPEDLISEPYHIHDNVITIKYPIEKHDIKLLNQILFKIK